MSTLLWIVIGVVIGLLLNDLRNHPRAPFRGIFICWVIFGLGYLIGNGVVKA